MSPTSQPISLTTIIQIVQLRYKIFVISTADYSYNSMNRKHCQWCLSAQRSHHSDFVCNTGGRHVWNEYRRVLIYYGLLGKTLETYSVHNATIQ